MEIDLRQKKRPRPGRLFFALILDAVLYNALFFHRQVKQIEFFFVGVVKSDKKLLFLCCCMEKILNSVYVIVRIFV